MLVQEVTGSEDPIMSLKTGSSKWSGSAASYIDYAEELSIGSDIASLRYHDRPQTGIVFTHVRGKAAEHLPGLNLERGITKEQHADLHRGAWNGVKYLQDGYAKVWEVDEYGKPIEIKDPETGKKRKIPVIDPATGKQKMERRHIAGYDISLSCSKDIVEHCIAHPEDIPVVQECLIAAGDKMMTVGVEEHAKLVCPSVKTPTQVGARTTKTRGSQTERQTADGLVWWSTIGHTARPTPESIKRGYAADPHLHLHIFLSTMAWKDGRWLTVDGQQLMKTADFRRDVAEVELSRLLEERGIKIEYSDVDRKGRRLQTIEGSKAENRRFFSTNSDRAWNIQAEYEAKYHKPMSAKDLALAMQVTKGAKTVAAKQADHGELDQYEAWRQAMVTAGLSLDMPARGVPVAYSNIEDTIRELHRRLESSEGLNRFTEDAAIFPASAVLPAAMRASVGLGMTPEMVRTLAADYLENHAVIVRDAVDPSARYYTTQKILDLEHAISDALDAKACLRHSSVDNLTLATVLDRQKNRPDPGQVELIRAICGSSQLVNGVGHAGAGKGFALEIAVAAMREANRDVEIAVCAVAAKRAGELARSLGAERGGSVESLHRQYANGWRPGANTVVILDEAALASTFDMAKLLEITRGKCKLVMIGDEKQGVPIGPAGWYGQELAKRRPVELVKVYRQSKSEDREMLDLLRAGRAPLALAKLHAKNRIHVTETADELVAQVRERYAVHRESGRGVDDVALVHQGSNQELDRYNRAVQLWRSEHGEIDRAESYVIDEASTGRRWTIAKGDKIIFNKGVFDGLSEPVRNGQTGAVLGVRADGSIRLQLDGDERRRVTVRLKPEMDVVPVGLAYCQSTSKYQGGQAPVVIITPGSPEIASQNSGYSQATRMVEHVEVLADRERWGQDPAKSIGVAWSTPETKIMASEVIGSSQSQIEPNFDPGSEESLTVDVDSRGRIVLAEDEESRETVADEAARYIEEIRQRMNYGEDFGLGL